MAPKATSNKSAAKKPDARKHAPPKVAARPSASSAKAVPRKAQPAHVLAKSAVKPAAPKTDHASKAPAKKPVAQSAKPVASKPVTQAKPVTAKPQAKAPVATAKPVAPQPVAGARPAGAIKPKALTAAQAAARAGTHRVPTTAPRQFGQAVTALAAPKAVAQKAMQTRQQPAPSKQAAAAAAVAASKKPVNQRHGFKTNEWIVYPAHGVGRIVGIEEQEIAGMSLELFVITFEKDKMTLRVPTGKSASVGMRKLAEEGIVKRAMETLKGRARVKRTMWSRRAQEYEAKINSGDLVAIAEVVRDLYRSESQPEQSYSERQLYEAALDRMAREIAAVEKLDERGAVQRITEVLSKSAKGRRAAAEEAEVKAA
jgi:CarD family transcriptional regulator